MIPAFVPPLSLKLLRTATAALLLAAPVVWAQRADIAVADQSWKPSTSALQALQEGRVEEAEVQLRHALDNNSGDAYAHQLLCRVYAAQDRTDEAVRECELAAGAGNQSNRSSSENQLWLGRVYGAKARHAGPIAGFKLARRVQAAFARAVELDPSNIAALNDLGEYYVEAPFIVGGGTDKARQLASSMMARFPGQAHLLLARIAAQDRDYPAAETEFKQVIVLQKSTQAWVDLAAFYQSRGRSDDAVASLKSAIAADRIHGPAIVDAASLLISMHREPELAEKCLRLYLASSAKTDEAPAFKVHVQLSRLLAARGLAGEAGQQMAAAAALAPVFARSSQHWQGL